MNSDIRLNPISRTYTPRKLVENLVIEELVQLGDGIYGCRLKDAPEAGTLTVLSSGTVLAIVTAAPQAGEAFVDFTLGTGLLIVHSSLSGSSVTIEYSGRGTVIREDTVSAIAPTLPVGGIAPFAPFYRSGGSNSGTLTYYDEYRQAITDTRLTLGSGGGKVGYFERAADDGIYSDDEAAVSAALGASKRSFTVVQNGQNFGYLVSLYGNGGQVVADFPGLTGIFWNGNNLELDFGVLLDETNNDFRVVLRNENTGNIYILDLKQFNGNSEPWGYDTNALFSDQEDFRYEARFNTPQEQPFTTGDEVSVWLFGGLLGSTDDKTGSFVEASGVDTDLEAIFIEDGALTVTFDTSQTNKNFYLREVDALGVFQGELITLSLDPFSATNPSGADSVAGNTYTYDDKEGGVARVVNAIFQRGASFMLWTQDSGAPALAATPNIAQINAGLGGNYRICDGTEYTDAESPVFSQAGRFLPGLVDSISAVFPVGTSASVGTEAGVNIPAGAPTLQTLRMYYIIRVK